MKRHIEIELKYAINPTEIINFKKHPLLTTLHAPKIEFLRSVYFDTPNLEIFNHGYGLRVLQLGEKFIQTLKNNGKSSAGLHERFELNSYVSALKPDLKVFEQGELPLSLLVSMQQEKLIPIFETSFQRESWNIFFARECVIEVAIDQGKIATAESYVPIHEIELELKQGKKTDLVNFGDLLAKELKLQPENKSKAEKGYNLLAKTILSPTT